MYLSFFWPVIIKAKNAPAIARLRNNDPKSLGVLLIVTVILYVCPVVINSIPSISIYPGLISLYVCSVGIEGILSILAGVITPTCSILSIYIFAPLGIDTIYADPTF